MGAGRSFPVEKVDDYNQAVMEPYAQDLVVQSVGVGFGLALILGFIMFISMIVCCCRCKSIHNNDLAAAGINMKGNPGLVQDQDTVTKHKRIMITTTILLVVAYVACAATAYTSALDSNDTMDSGYIGVDNFLTDLMLALCSDQESKDSSSTVNNCENDSVGDFFYDVRDTVDEYVAEVVVFVDELPVPLDWVQGNLTLAEASLNRSLAYIYAINSSVHNIKVLASSNGISVNVDYVSSSDVDSLKSGIASLDDANTQVDDSLQQIDDAISISEVTSQANNITSMLLDFVDAIYGVTDEILKIKDGDLKDGYDTASTNFELAATLVGAFVFLPALFIIIAGLCSGMCHSAKPFYVNMTAVFLLQGLYAVIGGIFLVVMYLTSDTCDVHTDIIHINLDGQTYKVQDITTNDLGVAVMATLDCTGQVGDVPSSTNNLVDIFGVGSIFNVSSDLQSIASTLNDGQDTIDDSASDLKTAQSSLKDLDEFIELDIRGTFNLTQSLNEVDTYRYNGMTAGVEDQFTSIDNNLYYVDGNMTLLEGEQATMYDLQQSMNNSLTLFLPRSSAMLAVLSTDLWSINDKAMTANEYTMCGYIGDMYSGLYLDTVCKSFVDDLEAVTTPLWAVVFIIFFSFCLHGVYATSLRKRPEELQNIRRHPSNNNMMVNQGHGGGMESPGVVTGTADKPFEKDELAKTGELEEEF